MRGGILPREADSSASLLKSALRGGLAALRVAAEAFRNGVAGGAAADLRETGNKLEVFELFQYTLAEIDAPPGECLPLAAAVRRATALDRFRSLWVLEGIGHAFAASAWHGPRPPRFLAASLAAAGLPDRVLIPLHAGVGLALAGRLLGGLTGSGSPGEARSVLRALIPLCADSSLPGYAGMTFEGAGFAACHLCPRAVPEIDRQLAALAPHLVAPFWHGVGRGLYFSPLRFLPGSAGSALAAAAGEPPHREGRLNAVHGAAWALALVNLRHPEVLDAFLAGPGRTADAATSRALAHGIASAVAIWFIAAGADDPLLAAFLRHRPSQPAAAESRQRLVVPLCRQALRRSVDLRRGRRLEELFRYRPQGGRP